MFSTQPSYSFHLFILLGISAFILFFIDQQNLDPFYVKISAIEIFSFFLCVEYSANTLNQDFQNGTLEYDIIRYQSVELYFLKTLGLFFILTVFPLILIGHAFLWFDMGDAFVWQSLGIHSVTLFLILILSGTFSFFTLSQKGEGFISLYLVPFYTPLLIINISALRGDIPFFIVMGSALLIFSLCLFILNRFGRSAL